MNFIRNTTQNLKQQIQSIGTSERIFSNLWFRGEICVLFSDSNIGKSTLANDIVFGILNGGWDFFGESSESCTVKEPLNVIYYDFETSDEQYMVKYRNMPNVNFSRITMDYSDDCFSFDAEDVASNINLMIRDDCHNIVVVDNLSAIEGMVVGGFRKIREFIYQLKRIITLTGNTSILLLAHTVKRNQTKPITQNDLLGSKAIINFCDSAFALGASVKGEDVRYIKQIKSRQAMKYEEVAEIYLEPTPYPHFVFGEWNYEEEHLKKNTIQNRSRIDEKLGGEIMLQFNLGKSTREIASLTGIPKSTVHRYIIKHINSSYDN